MNLARSSAVLFFIGCITVGFSACALLVPNVSQGILIVQADTRRSPGTEETHVSELNSTRTILVTTTKTIETTQTWITTLASLGISTPVTDMGVAESTFLPYLVPIASAIVAIAFIIIVMRTTRDLLLTNVSILFGIATVTYFVAVYFEAREKAPLYVVFQTIGALIMSSTAFILGLQSFLRNRHN